MFYWLPLQQWITYQITVYAESCQEANLIPSATLTSEHQVIALPSGVCSLSLLLIQQLSRIEPSQWLALDLEWAPVGAALVPKGPLQRLLCSHLKTALLSCAGVGKAREQQRGAI